MIVELDRSSDEPPHAQLTRQLIRLIADGTLAVGAQLPTVRQLSGDLGIAPNTVARCIKDLEAAGLLATHGRRGTTVKIAGRRVNLAEVSDRLRRLPDVRDVWVGVSPGAEPVLGAVVATSRSVAELRAALLTGEYCPVNFARQSRFMGDNDCAARPVNRFMRSGHNDMRMSHR